MARRAQRYQPGDILVFKQPYRWDKRYTEYTVIVILDAYINEDTKTKPMCYKYLMFGRIKVDTYLRNRCLKKVSHNTLRHKIRKKHWGEESSKLEYVVQFGGFDDTIIEAINEEKRRVQIHLDWYARHTKNCQDKMELLDKTLKEHK